MLSRLPTNLAEVLKHHRQMVFEMEPASQVLSATAMEELLQGIVHLEFRIRLNLFSSFGICCVFIKTNGNSAINQNCSYVSNPGFPNSYTDNTAVTYTVNKLSSAVCLIRLDFDTFTISGPSDTAETLGGVCPDTLDVTSTSGSAFPIPQICGSNSGQHIYVDVSGTGGTGGATLGFTFDNTITNPTRQWDIKVTQIPCASDNAYSICVRRTSGFCCTQYTPCVDVGPPAFSLSLGDGALTGALVETSCTFDYVLIDGSSSSCLPGGNTGQTNNKYCGINLNQSPLAVNVPICDCSAPFRVEVVTDALPDIAGGNTNTVALSRGICFQYMQIRCP
ncbi:hypothetical protein TCAL_06510 [Tigriopus californicus]|uniref:CUB domain-containing protein n=1 Tax=Tigriopus californicus TaxID=6832 RepID=A0A553P4H6_TIGCA|nr:hypothetical protein TCAL_06510 [Tigriopus californicus]|eukprot:TCALIF_06510-PA protein Name:"Protein of unknown function" AED:0.05 eAED:0.05 QI:217/0.8/0.90/1/0.4/0.45/11/129/334